MLLFLCTFMLAEIDLILFSSLNLPGEADQEEKESPENTVDDDPIPEASTTPNLEESDENSDGDSTEGDDEAEEDSELEEQDAEENDNDVSTIRTAHIVIDSDSEVEAGHQADVATGHSEATLLEGTD